MALPSQLWMDAPEKVVKRGNSSPKLIEGNGQSQEVKDFYFSSSSYLTCLSITNKMAWSNRSKSSNP